jgi:hypothetical protein
MDGVVDEKTRGFERDRVGADEPDAAGADEARDVAAT